MNDPIQHLEILAVLIDRLIEEADPRVQERILVEQICDQGWAQAATLLREAQGTKDGWIEVLARGPRDLLPTSEQVAAIDGGTLPRELPMGKRALFAADRTGRVALGLGGCATAAEEDLLGSLFEVFCRFTAQTVDSVWGDVELLDVLQPPVPTEPDEQQNDDEN